MGLLKDAEKHRVLEAELVEELRQIRATMTEWAARMTGRLTNDVLAVETRAFDATASLSRSYRVTVGAIEVTNHSSTATVTVVAGPLDSAAPSVGTGVYVVPVSSTRTIAIGGPEVSLYGTNGESVSYQVFAAAVRPVA